MPGVRSIVQCIYESGFTRFRIGYASVISYVFLAQIAAGLAVVWLVPLAWALDTALKPEWQTTTIPARWFVPEMGFGAFARR